MSDLSQDSLYAALVAATDATKKIKATLDNEIGQLYARQKAIDTRLDHIESSLRRIAEALNGG